MIDKQRLEMKIIETLQAIYDPEIPANIYDLGLVYKIDISDTGYVNLTMTLTAPACPVAGEIIMEVDNKIRFRATSQYSARTRQQKVNKHLFCCTMV